MVQTEAPISTRYQARIDAQDEKIQNLSTEMKALCTTVNSIQETLEGLPDFLEQTISNLLKKQGKQPMGSDGDGSVHHNASGSGSFLKSPESAGFVHEKQPEDAIFSLPKVKLPLFDGDDPRGWITKAELYFQVHHTPPAQKLFLVQMCMEGSALNWFTNLLFRHPQTDWTQFRSKLLSRFSGTRFLNPYEALGSLYQEGDVDEYIADFESISALIPNQSEEQSVGMFLRGLRDDVRNWVRTLNPTTCDAAMDAARRVELATGSDSMTTDWGRDASALAKGHSQAQYWRKYINNNGPRCPRPTYLDQPTTISTQLPNTNAGPKLVLPDAANPTRQPTTRHLSKQEWEDRRKRGLCFTCGQRYSPQHKCPEAGLRVMLLADGELVDDEGGVYVPEAAA